MYFASEHKVLNETSDVTLALGIFESPISALTLLTRDKTKAERSAQTNNWWYIAGINGDTIEKKISLDLTPFKKSKGTLFTDGVTNELFSKTVLNTTRQKKYDIVMNANGGFIIVLE